MSQETAARQACILVVEDEVLVRMFAVDALEDAGFTVEQAGNAHQCLDMFRQAAHGLCAAIIDLGLPDRSGDQLAGEIRALHSALPILIASGRSEQELRERYSSDPHLGILAKPYTAAMLLDALASLGVSPAAAQ